MDEDGRGGTDRQVADAHRHRKRTVENVRWHCVLEGFEPAPNGKQRSRPPVPKRLNGKQEAQLIARMGGPSDLRTQIAARSTDVNPPQRGVEWRLKINAARRKLKAVYPRFNL